MKEEITNDEKLLIEAMTKLPNGRATNNELSSILGWKIEKVNYTRKKLEDKGIIKKTGEKKDRANVYIIILAASTMIGLGFSLYEINKLKTNLTQERTERMRADQYLAQKQIATLSALEEVRRQQNMDREEFLNYIDQLQKGQVQLSSNIAQVYGITQRDIQDLALREDLRYAYTQQEFSLVGRDITELRTRATISEARLTHGELVDMIVMGKISDLELQQMVLEGRITNEELKSALYDAKFKDIYNQLDDDDDDDDGSGGGGGSSDKNKFIEEEYKRVEEGKSPQGRTMPETGKIDLSAYAWNPEEKEESKKLYKILTGS